MFAEHTQNPEFFHMAKRMNVIDAEGDLYMDQGQWAAVCKSFLPSKYSLAQSKLD